MKVNFSKWRLNINLYLGLLWSFMGAFRLKELLDGSEFLWYNTLFIVLGPIYLLIYFFQKKNGLLQIDEQRIKLFGPPNKTIAFNELSEIKFSAGDYIFKNLAGKNITVAKESIASGEREAFETKFRKILHDFQLKNTSDHD